MEHLSVENNSLQGGKYKLIRFIGSGGFGCTYEAEHVMLHKRIAIKEFFVKDFCNREAQTGRIVVGAASKVAFVEKLKRKFIEEARALAGLHHPNIVKVTDVFEENGTAYYVMDYIDGVSLGEIVRQRGPLSESIATKYVKQVADALKCVHDHHRMHLDVKPDNILIDSSDTAILIDFGVSKQYDEEGDSNTSTLLGMTPGYAPLEQLGNDVMEFYPATDIYALGATFYKLLTGITPPGANKLASGEEDLRPLPKKISTETRKAIEAAMQLRKKVRPQSIDDFLRELQCVGSSTPFEGEGTETTEIQNRENTVLDIADREKTPSTVDNRGESSRGRSKLLLMSCVVGIVLIVAGWFIVKGIQSKDKLDNGQTVTVSNHSYTSTKGLTFRYTGPVDEQGRPHGEGVGVYPKKGVYRGNYVEGLRVGEGSFEHNTDHSFEGTFADDVYEEGILTWKGGEIDGCYFKGTFKDGQPYNGSWYEKNQTYAGKVIDGQFL